MDATALREHLVATLVARGVIREKAVAKAFRDVPRHLFVPLEPLEVAYGNHAIPVKRVDGWTLSSSSQPEMMAVMIEQLGLQPEQRVLEIGAGSGYNAAVMARLVAPGGSVVTIDIEPDLVEASRANVWAAGIDNVAVVCGDGALGYPPGAPYNRIIATAALWDIAPALREQLAPGGRLLLPLAVGGVQLSVAFESEGDHLASVSVLDCGFMRLRGPHTGPDRKIDLAPGSGLRIHVHDGRTIDTVPLYRSLTGPGARPVLAPAAAGPTTMDEVVVSLSLWLALREPALCHLIASGTPEVVAANAVPQLTEWINGPWRERVTPGLVAADGTLAVLTRRPDRYLDQHDPTPIDLWVAGFGPSPEGLMDRLARTVEEWHGAGRPSLAGLRVTAWPPDTEVHGEPNVLVIPKKDTKLFISGPAVGAVARRDAHT